MEERVRTQLSRRGLILHGTSGDTELPLWSAAFHYWRVDTNAWAPCLAAMKSLGLTAVSTWVPWSVHEESAKSFRFDGWRDLGRFLDLVSEAGLVAAIRPGPRTDGELTGFGFPDRVLKRADVQAKTARDTPLWVPAPTRMFPVPSYASRRFGDEVTRWLAAVGEVVAPRLYPNGPVVAVEVDSGLPSMFRDGAYDHDYHPDALEWWREFSGDAEAPRQWSPDQSDRCARWVEFKHHYHTRALGWIQEALKAGGISGIARTHAVPGPSAPRARLASIARGIDGVCGLNFHHLATNLAGVRRDAVFLAGSQALPFASEIGVGRAPWQVQETPQGQQQVILTMLAGGVRAGNFVMAVGRDRWADAAIDPGGPGEERPGSMAAWLHRLLTVLRRVEWPSLSKRAQIALVRSHADTRYATASDVLDPLPATIGDLLGLGQLGRDENANAHGVWMDAVFAALDRAELPFVLVDEDADTDFSSYGLVILPTTARVSGSTWERLRTAAEAGTRVVLGPGLPVADEFGKPTTSALFRGAGLLRSETLRDPDGLADDLVAACEGVVELCDDWLAPDAPEVTCSMFETPTAQPRVLFVTNTADRSIVADVVVPPTVRLDEPLNDAPPPPMNDGVLVVELAPHSTRLFEVSAETR